MAWRTLELETELALQRGDGVSAELHARAAWMNAVDRHGPDHPYVSDALAVLGRALLQTGQRDAAIQTLRDGVELVEVRCGPDHPQVLRLLVPLAEAVQDESELAALRSRIGELRTLHRFDQLDALRPTDWSRG